MTEVRSQESEDGRQEREVMIGPVGLGFFRVHSCAFVDKEASCDFVDEKKLRVNSWIT